ncbi:FAD synthase [Candidatus Bathyarchaeota archaeon]|nr:MAG: FAD synthase [Candidatus Bathyarchaeota archaeon]
MKKKRRILVGGVFDIIHVGHIRFLWAAKKLADPSELIVVIARDETVRKFKGRDPVFSETERLEIVRNLKPVDMAILGYKIDDEYAFYKVILDYRPDIIALGYDQIFNEEKLLKWAQNNGIALKVIRLPKFSFEGLNSSSAVRKRIFELLGKKKREITM